MINKQFIFSGKSLNSSLNFTSSKIDSNIEILKKYFFIINSNVNNRIFTLYESNINSDKISIQKDRNSFEIHELLKSIKRE